MSLFGIFDYMNNDWSVHYRYSKKVFSLHKDAFLDVKADDCWDALDKAHEILKETLECYDFEIISVRNDYKTGLCWSDRKREYEYEFKD